MLCYRATLALLILAVTWPFGNGSAEHQSVPSRLFSAKQLAYAAKPAESSSRDSALSVYSSPAYHISFRHPDAYILLEAIGSKDPETLQLQNELTLRQPGSIFVASVAISRSAYSNTTFRSGTLRFAVNPTVPSGTCRSFAAPADETYSSGSTSIRGVAFAWRQRGSVGMGTGYLNRDYSGFSAGICYEFFLEVVSGSNPDADPRITDADSVGIMRNLSNIVSSVQIQRPTTKPSVQPFPIINSFSVEPIPHRLLQNVVRVSWDISGASTNEVFLRANCPGSIPTDLNPLPDPNFSQDSDSRAPTDPPTLEEAPDPYSNKTFFRLESIFSCGSFTPIPPHSGTFRLQIEPHSGESVSFTLAVAHLDYLTRQVK